MPDTSVTLLTKPGCHLCDDARVVVLEVLAQLGSAASGRIDIGFVELSILDDPALLAEYAEEIPVVLINGRVHNQWRIDPQRLRTALLAAAS